MHSAYDRALFDAADRHLAIPGRASDDDDIARADAEIAAHMGCAEGAPLCSGCHDDACEDIAAEHERALADAPEADRDWQEGTLCSECGRHMADPHRDTDICSACAASWFTNVTVPADISEGPRPMVFDVAGMVAA